MAELYKYQGAGNDFILVDGRRSAGCDASFVTEDFIRSICDRRYGIGADGLMILEDSDEFSFKMVYFNSDGSGGMMCGNGGRCIVAFARDLGIDRYDFEAADGPHDAQLLPSGDIRLKMKDAGGIELYDDASYRIDTGTRHFVRFVESVDDVEVVPCGREIRYREEFAPVGTNVNFVEPCDGRLLVRTYEKGVEDETYACGTGIVASAISAYVRGIVPSEIVLAEEGGCEAPERVRYDVSALHDDLAVDFVPCFGQGDSLPEVLAQDVWLTGPAKMIAKIII